MKIPRLKIIPLHTHEKKLIKKASGDNRSAQHELYKRYAPRMLSVCRYYIRDIHHAEDVMITGFFKVFTRIGDFRSEGSFEGWIRQIMVRECISFLRREKPVIFLEDDDGIPQDGMLSGEGAEEMESEEVQLLIDELPEGYKTVLLMFAVEGYSHKEIAATLNISESTSKSQLFKARRMLQERIKEIKKQENGTR